MRRSSVRTPPKTGTVQAKVTITPELSLFSKLSGVIALEFGRWVTVGSDPKACQETEDFTPCTGMWRTWQDKYSKELIQLKASKQRFGRSGQNSLWRLTALSSVFLLGLGSWQPNSRLFLMPLISYGPRKHLPVNLPESSGVPVSMVEDRSLPQLAHHGMIFVPLGYTFGSGMFEMNEVKGGSSYGAGTYAADGSRQSTVLELLQAFHQGKKGS
ncbi:Quinone reductase family protein [Actinidia rufa]|uniref:Quinone reductase family protein n=1 Tax=Actinidia rufa TaxID=165716 RepID=A0A7J0GR65_9ERIC|nr:Quinone reductase family protein [Actinidia rufa]